ncbi:response regulator [Azohydromonas sediminis]|uniref:response regulator n=1 Tax=Azohydromonas sediminis TaxID=2259674 RepID=UPI000E64ACAC|nr:response regulator [Azohydromonas sediminis]
MDTHTDCGSKVRVLVVDDHTLFRRGLVALLAADGRFEVVGEAADANEAQRAAAQCRPQVILLDNHLPGVAGVDALPALRAAAPQARVLMLTVSEDERDLAAALRGGAAGYLLKTADSDELAQAIERAARGEASFSAAMTPKLAAAFGGGAATAPDTPAPADDDALASLSPREREILELIARGHSNKEIARALAIAETTVKIHVQHILRKLNLSSRVQAAVVAASRRSG